MCRIGSKARNVGSDIGYWSALGSHVLRELRNSDFLTLYDEISAFNFLILLSGMLSVGSDKRNSSTPPAVETPMDSRTGYPEFPKKTSFFRCNLLYTA